MPSKVSLDFDRLGPGQQRAITFLWAATQVAARVVREAFVQIYASLPDSKNGHTSLKDYCSLAGQVGVYLELLDDGYMHDVLTSSPKETTFLDIKVVRLILDRVLAERFGKDKYRKLTFEVRQLVYLRNDLCHQLLPALTVKQYLSHMKQLKTRLCVVICEASFIAGATRSPDEALKDIHGLFASLLHKDEAKAEKATQTYLQLPAILETATHTPHRVLQNIQTLFVSLLHHDKPKTNTSTQTDQLPSLLETTTLIPANALQKNHALSASLLHHHENSRADNGTQTDLQAPETLDKGVQARVDYQKRDAREGTWGDADHNTEHLTSSHKHSADAKGLSAFSRSLGLASTRGKTRRDDKTGKGEGKEKQRVEQEWHKQTRHERCCDACPFSSQSSFKSLHRQHDGKNWEDSRNLLSPQDTLSRLDFQDAPGRCLSDDDLVSLKKLSYEAVTVNHIFMKIQDDDRLPLEILIALVLKVMLFLVVLIVSLLPLAITLLRVVLDGIQCSWNNADRVYMYLSELFNGPRWQEAVFVPEVVLVPRLDPMGKIAPHHLRDIDMDYRRANRKAWCRRKGRRN